MNAPRILRALSIVLFWAVLNTTAVSSQMPARPGKLVITSASPGATIVINGTTRPEVTPVTLIVPPGVYKVAVGNCSEQSIQVSSGDTKEVHCP
jgi:PEGA domain